MKHRLSSIAYPQYNGWVELTIKTAKRIVNGDTGPHSFITNPLQATPQMDIGSIKLYEILHHGNVKMVEMYNRYTHNLCPFQAGDTLAIQSPLNHQWNTTRKIITVLPDRQYQIRADGSGRLILRNYHFLTKCKIKASPTPIPSGIPKPITSIINVPLLHPDPLTSSGNDTCTAIELPKESMYTLTRLQSSKIP